MASSDRDDYERIINRVYKYAQSLQDDNDKRLVQQWITRLSEETKSSSARHNRNLYARYLEYQLRHQSLRFPFNLPPPHENLQPLADVVYGTKHMPKSTGRTLHTSSKAVFTTKYSEPSKEEGEEKTTLYTQHELDIIRSILAELGPNVSLTQFVRLVSPYTADKGIKLQRIMHKQLDQFRSFVEHMLQVRNRDFADLLFKQHAIKMDHYNSRQERLYNQLQSDHARLYKLVPNWSWERFRSDPSYLENIFRNKLQEDADLDLLHEAVENFTLWREEVKLKLSLLQQLISNLEKENEELTDILYVIRQTSYDRQTMNCLTGQMQYENNLGLYGQVKLLRSERDSMAKSIELLEQELSEKG